MTCRSISARFVVSESFLTTVETVKTAVAMAVLEFKLGPRGFERVLDKMGIEPKKPPCGAHQETN